MPRPGFPSLVQHLGIARRHAHAFAVKIELLHENGDGGQREAHRAQRMHVVSSFIITAPIWSRSRAGIAKCRRFLDGFGHPVFVLDQLAQPTSLIRFSGHTSTQPLHATHLDVSNTVLTLQPQAPRPLRRASASGVALLHDIERCGTFFGLEHGGFWRG